MNTYTTPTLPVTIADINFADVQVFRFKMAQPNRTVLKVIEAGSDYVDAEHHKIYVPLTQEETAKFKDGDAQVQIRIKFNNGTVLATEKKTVPVEEVLDEVII